MLAMMLGGGEIFILLVMLPICVFWLWMLVSAIQNKGLTDSERICWVLAIVFAHFLGAIIYYFIGHPKRLNPRTVIDV